MCFIKKNFSSFHSSFFTNFVKLDPDPHSEKLLDPDLQK